VRIASDACSDDTGLVPEVQTFAVGIYGLGRRMVGFPFGRFKIDDTELAAWSWPRGRWIEKKVVREEDVARIGIVAPYRVVRLDIDAQERRPALTVECPWRATRLIKWLRRLGYNVVDLR
jgi:hypothetical protein